MPRIFSTLTTSEAAWREATVFAGERFKGIDGKIRPDQNWELHVSDESRRPLFRIHVNTESLK